jgi:hypothetical protein
MFNDGMEIAQADEAAQSASQKEPGTRTDDESQGETSDPQTDIELQKERERKWRQAHAPRMRAILSGLVLGNVRSSYSRELLQEHHINAVVSLTDARWVWWRSITREAGIPESRHKWVQCVDSSTQDILVHLSEICDFIDDMASSALRALATLPATTESLSNEALEPQKLQKAILIHCDLGVSRSPTVIIAYLMRKVNAKLDDVLAFVQARQNIKPSSTFLRQLQIWQDTGFQIWANAEKTIPKRPYQAYLDDRAALLKAKGRTGNEPLAPLNL